MGRAQEAGRCRLDDRFCDTFGIGEHFVVPEADYVPALLFEERRAVSVISDGIEVLASVQLDGQLCLSACEVEDEVVYDHLAGEPWAVAGEQPP